MKQTWVPAHSGNFFLDSLQPGEAERFGSRLSYEAMARATPIAALGEPIARAWFPVTGVISAVVQMADGTDVETSLVGREGFYGLAILLADGIAHGHAMAQIPGGAWWIDAAGFAAALREFPHLRARALRYAQLSIQTVGQLAACNRLHSIDERLARWLLMAHDRIPHEPIELTQEYLATMLGVRRPTVSIAAAALEAASLISYERGAIVLTDRAGLSAVACEYYGLTCGFVETLMGYRIGKDRAA